MQNFVNPEELDYFVESLRPFPVREVGNAKWLEVHEMIIKLSQQATLEAIEHREEEVREFLCMAHKLNVLVHEAYCIFLWKTRVLPHLLEIDPNPQATFLIYTVLFHEAAVISLLDTTLFHSSACEVLKDSAIDLVDYCAQGVAQLIGLVSMGYHENETNLDVDEAVLTELERQKRDIIYKIGLRCISILNYLADNTVSLPLSATRRMVVTHDVPWLMTEVLHFRPWQKQTKNGVQKIIDDKWKPIPIADMSEVTKHEAHAWFCLRQLLFNKAIMQNYEFNSERCKQLSKCQGLLNDIVLDQLPPLIELKQFLCQLSVTAVSNDSKSNLLLEEVPEICENLIKESEHDGGFLAIAQAQENIFLCNDKNKIMEMAKCLSNAYSTDLLVEYEQRIEETEKHGDNITLDTRNDADISENKLSLFCAKCAGHATKKCGKCKNAYYCSRACQQADWPNHKGTCVEKN
ncbi:zinc finger MYND domain-containing protein 10 homolog [Teleopsis dalmanni]|uniref:zinc finger MYND domain-containing protein 10 homolog n=1 Tax=Teleopsis dalmanni TaxID=139649 RepID=UPI0018CFAA6E|nr:zinc finger MYND domain-containing protein 10 homolog [Teleopsis dalmanni]